MNFKTLDSESFTNSTKSSPDTGGDPKLQSGAARLEPVLKQPTKTTVGLNSTKETSSYSEPSEDRAVQHQTFLQEDGSRDVQNGEEVEDLLELTTNGQPGTPVGNKVIEKTTKASTASKQMKKLKSLVQVQASGESPRRSKRISQRAGIEMDTSEVR